MDRATRTHLACRIPASGKGDHDVLTIVLDARTGQVTGQHASHSTWALQLTDSALLDGATAYDLNTGEVRWALPHPGGLTGGDIKRRDVHSGAAGHSSFVLMSTQSGDNTGLRATVVVFNSAYGSSSGHGQRGPEAGHAYRLHGLPEGAS